MTSKKDGQWLWIGGDWIGGEVQDGDASKQALLMLRRMRMMINRTRRRRRLRRRMGTGIWQDANLLKLISINKGIDIKSTVNRHKVEKVKLVKSSRKVIHM